MRKLNLNSFENDTFALDHLLEIRGGSGGRFTCSAIIMTICCGGDHDTDSKDYDVQF